MVMTFRRSAGVVSVDEVHGEHALRADAIVSLIFARVGL